MVHVGLLNGGKQKFRDQALLGYLSFFFFHSNFDIGPFKVHFTEYLLWERGRSKMTLKQAPCCKTMAYSYGTYLSRYNTVCGYVVNHDK